MTSFTHWRPLDDTLIKFLIDWLIDFEIALVIHGFVLSLLSFAFTFINGNDLLYILVKIFINKVNDFSESLESSTSCQFTLFSSNHRHNVNCAMQSGFPPFSFLLATLSAQRKNRGALGMRVFAIDLFLKQTKLKKFGFWTQFPVKHKQDYFRKSFFIRSAKLWNFLPSSLKSCHSLTQFKSYSGSIYMERSCPW